MRLLELFCGTKSVSRVFHNRGHEVFTVDIEPLLKPNLCIDILDFDVKKLPKEWRKPDIIWASPPCTTFSVMCLPHYWINSRPRSYKTYIGLAIAKKTIEIIKELNPRYFFIENPVGMLRKQDFMLELPRRTVTYCQYGKTYRKATDIWTNATTWIPKKPCSNGDLCHTESRRGFRGDIQGVVNPALPPMADWCDDALARGVIPQKLCEEICDVSEGKIKIIQTSL